ncbi:MAG: hypothetical protein RLY40_936 [Pseudomonadota bacterium]|jgi:hypothetical protein
MKAFLLSCLTASLFILSSSAFAVTTEECRAAWKSSPAYQSCYPAFGTKAIDNKCGMYVHCKKPDGSEVANGSYTANYDKEHKDIIGSDYSLFYTVDEVKKLNNCNGKLKVGAC